MMHNISVLVLGGPAMECSKVHQGIASAVLDIQLFGLLALVIPSRDL